MNRTLVVIASVLGAVACKHPDTKDPDTEQCTPVLNEHCETGDDDTTDGDTGGPDPLGPDECVHNVTEDRPGYRMQCEGELFTTLEFNLPFGYDCESALGADFCSQHHVFGPP